MSERLYETAAHLETCLELLDKTVTRTDGTGKEIRKLFYNHGTGLRASLVQEAQFWLNLVQYEEAQQISETGTN